MKLQTWRKFPSITTLLRRNALLHHVSAHVYGAIIRVTRY